MAGLRAILQARTDGAGDGGGTAPAWPVALARAAQDAIGLDLRVEGARTATVSLAELLDLPPERALLAVLEGPGEGLGLMVLSPEVLASAVEWQTLGRVQAGVPAPRRPTRTDAAMVSGLIDRALAGLEAGVAGTADQVWAAGFRYASCLAEARALALILEDAPFRLIEVTVSLAEGTRTGRVTLALPAKGRGPAAPLHEARAEAAAALVFEAALSQQVEGAQAMLEAVIARVALPLSLAMALAPGEVLRLPGAALDRIDLAALTGARAGGGRLGQAGGMRAVRLDAGCLPVARAPADLAPGIATVEEALRRTGTG